MAALSDHLLVVAILGYALAMLAYAAEYAFGNHGVVARVAVRQRELVAAAVGGGAASPVERIGSAGPADGDRAGERDARVALWAGWAGVALNLVGWLAHLSCLVTRGAAGHQAGQV